MRWPTQPLKHLAEVPITNGVGEAAEHEDPAWPRYVRTTDIAGPRTLRADTFKSLPPDVAARAPLAQGDIVMTAAGGVGKSMTYSDDAPACYAGYLVRFRPRAEVDGRYVAYWMESQHYWDQVNAGKVVSTIDNFSAGKYQNLRCPYPNFEQQRAIADFLDAETGRIDALITKKQQMIEVLETRTESLLATVLDPIIDRWGEVPLKSVSAIDVSNVDKKAYEGQTAVLLCNYTDVYYNRAIDRSIDFMAATADSRQIEQFTLAAGDVLITKDSETADDIAVPALVTEDLPGVILGYHLALLRPSAIRGDFLYWALLSRRCRDAFSLAASGVTRVGLRRDSVGRVPVPAAPVDIQAEVAAQLDRAAGLSDATRRSISEQIELLREHRRALITAAVTGELEISGVAE